MASYIFSTYTYNLILWIISFIWGNKGGFWHTLSYWNNMFMSFTALYLIISPIIAGSGYGTRAETYTSWSGSTITITGAVYTLSTPTATWVSDYKYLMWTD